MHVRLARFIADDRHGAVADLLQMRQASKGTAWARADRSMTAQHA